jgi:hypothetical protein
MSPRRLASSSPSRSRSRCRLLHPGPPRPRAARRPPRLEWLPCGSRYRQRSLSSSAAAAATATSSVEKHDSPATNPAHRMSSATCGRWRLAALPPYPQPVATVGPPPPKGPPPSIAGNTTGNNPDPEAPNPNHGGEADEHHELKEEEGCYWAVWAEIRMLQTITS